VLPTTLVLVETDGISTLCEVPQWPWTRLAARLRAYTLDRRLAAGEAPESHVLLAARARALVAPAVRSQHATLLAQVEARARRSWVPRSARAPLNRGAVVACADRFDEVRQRLLGRHPVSACGMALTSLLLTDGAGPLYNPRLSAGDLSRALEQIKDQLDPLREFDSVQ
jgi:hypothetical protein